MGFYGTLYDGVDNVLAFQTKTNWRNPADLNLIAYSAGQLDTLARKWKHATFHLNFPGIGLGGLREDEVEPIIRTLPENVVIWKKA
jgi:hypothetical protein